MSCNVYFTYFTLWSGKPVLRLNNEETLQKERSYKNVTSFWTIFS